jgi:hypothetical protein
MSQEEYMNDYLEAKKSKNTEKMRVAKKNWKEHYSMPRGLPLKVKTNTYLNTPRGPIKSTRLISNPDLEKAFLRYHSATIARNKNIDEEKKKAENLRILKNIVRNDPGKDVDRVMDIFKKNKKVIPHKGYEIFLNKQKNKTRKRSSLVPVNSETKTSIGGRKRKTKNRKQKKRKTRKRLKPKKRKTSKQKRRRKSKKN